MRDRQVSVTCFLGTRPEAIKLAPVIRALREHPSSAEVVVCSTGQHREMLDQALGFFDLRPDVDLQVMRREQSLAGLTSQLFEKIDDVLTTRKPDWVLVQGDTTTAMVAAMASFYHRTSVGHVEAGLRTYDPFRPFPEEINRRIISLVSGSHFAPTERARQALLVEGVKDDDVLVTGNTVVDAMQQVAGRLDDQPPPALAGIMADVGERHVILVTGHRRESFGEGFARICRALGTLASTRSDVVIVYPVHLNPRVRASVDVLLRGRENVHLLEPLDYPDFLWLMAKCSFVLTDSGGVQEEAPNLGKPVLVIRDTTERPEGVEAGNTVVVGTDESRILTMATQLLDEPTVYARMAQARSPYGDGHAASRIAERIVRG